MRKKNAVEKRDVSGKQCPFFSSAAVYSAITPGKVVANPENMSFGNFLGPQDYQNYPPGGKEHLFLANPGRYVCTTSQGSPLFIPKPGSPQGSPKRTIRVARYPLTSESSQGSPRVRRRGVPYPPG